MNRLGVYQREALRFGRLARYYHVRSLNASDPNMIAYYRSEAAKCASQADTARQATMMEVECELLDRRN